MLRAAVVNWKLCRSCSPCSARQVCTLKALLKIDEDEPACIDAARCRGCGVCLPACPYSAISLALPDATGRYSAGAGPV